MHVTQPRGVGCRYFFFLRAGARCGLTAAMSCGPPYIEPCGACLYMVLSVLAFLRNRAHRKSSWTNVPDWPLAAPVLITPVPQLRTTLKPSPRSC